MNETTTFELSSPTAVQQMARAEIDSQITTAKQYPRNIAKVKSNMLSFATLDAETAESCFYSLPRGGKNIEGPSVRLAEIAVACYGNIRAGVRILETISAGDNPHVVIQAICHDLENNTAVTIEKRRRIVKKKSKDQIDEDDINLAANAGSAIAFRDAVYKIVPGALIKPIYEAAKQVAIGDAKSIGDRRIRAVESLAKMGISKDRVLAAVGKTHIDLIDVDDLEKLFGLHTAVKDGQISLDDAFPATAPTTPQFAPPAAATAPTPAAAKKKEAKAAPVAPTPQPTPEPPKSESEPAKPVEPAQPEPVATVAPETAPDDGLGDPLSVPTPTESPEMAALQAAMVQHDVTPAMLVRFSSNRNLMKESAYGQPIETLGLADIRTDKLAPLTKNILAAGDTLKKIKSA